MTANTLSTSEVKHAKPSVLVLGAKGNLGRAAVLAFAAAGWRVIAVARSAMDFPVMENLEHLLCDALDTSKLIAAVGQVDVVVHALNPDYARWDTLLAPSTAAAIRIAQGTGGLLMVPGNVYNFGSELPPLLSEETAFAAHTGKGLLRIQMERSIAAASVQGLRSVVIRAGDFLGGKQSWLDLAITKSLHKNVVTRMGPEDLPHAWAYLPDLAEVFVRVAERRNSLSGYQVFHYPGLSASAKEMHQALESITGRKLRIKALPWWLFKLIALVSPLLRSVVQMRYLWQRPHQLVSTRLENFIGPLPATSLQQALAASIR